MAVTCAVWEAYGASSTTATSYLNFLAVDEASGADATTQPASHPIAIPASTTVYSYERWFWLVWAGNSNAITSVYVWKSAGTLNTGYVINAAVKTPNPTTYVQAVTTASSYATGAIPTTQGAGLTPTYNASGTKSDFVVSQLAVASTASAGPMVGTPASPGTWTMAYQYNTTG
jgi:hypothetical protein